MTDSVLDTQVIRERLGGMSQGAFGSLFQLDQSAVSLWETGRNSPSKSVTTLILQKLESEGIEPAWKARPEKQRRVA